LCTWPESYGDKLSVFSSAVSKKKGQLIVIAMVSWLLLLLQNLVTRYSGHTFFDPDCLHIQARFLSEDFFSDIE